jgi:UDPglucose--hexose-1-phosphate uridylyltransferase
VRRTRTELSDGRELIYYDSDGAPRRIGHDARVIGPRSDVPELRHDALRDEWVSVATHRQERTFLPADDACPLCPSRDGAPTEIPAPDYHVVVFENRFPSFDGPPSAIGEPGSLLERRDAAGRCEVVCFTSDHDGSFAALDLVTARLVVDVWAERTEVLAAAPGVAQVFVFENRGEAIGVTLRHPHGQIYGYPFVTPVTRVALEAAARHLAATGRNLYDDLLDAELADGRRIVTTSEHWVCFVPFASRWPVEAHLYPRRRVPDLPSLTASERDDLARVQLDLLRRADAFYDAVPALPYIAAWHQAPVNEGRDLAALHLELFSVQRATDRLKYLAGSESAMGAFVNDRSPEDVAARLREVGAP